MHFAEVYHNITKEVGNMVSESKAKSKSGGEISLQDMAELLRTMPKQEEMMKIY